MVDDFDPYHRWLGIPPDEQPPDHYRLLGLVRFEGDSEVISNASDQRMTHLRTFASGKRAADSQRLLNEVSAATRCLLDVEKKQKYDAELRAKIAAKEAKSAARSALPVAAALPARPLSAPTLPSALPIAPAVNLTPIAVSVVEAPPSPDAARALPTAATVHAGRRPVRKASQSQLPLIVGIGAVVLFGAFAVVAYRASQSTHADPVVQRPANPVPTPPKDPTQRGNNTSTTTTKTGAEETTDPARSTDDRVAWFYPRAIDGPYAGALQRVEKNQWKQTETSGNEVLFQEVQRTSDFVLLKNSEIEQQVRLYADRIEFSRNGAWRAGQKGSWVKSDLVASLLESARKTLAQSTPSVAEQKRLAWFYIDKGQRGNFSKLGDGQWQEALVDAVKHTYRQTAETAAYIELEEAGGEFRTRLFSDHLESTAASSDGAFTRSLDGRWVVPKDLAVLMKRPTMPASTKPPSTGGMDSIATAKVSTLWFESTKSAVRITTPQSVLAVSAPFTVECWLRRTDDLQKGAGIFRLGELNVSCKRGDDGDKDATTFEFFNGRWIANTVFSAPDNKWHHVALIGDGEAVKLFFDGKPAAAVKLSELDVNVLEPIEIGSAASNDGQIGFQGEMRSLRIVAGKSDRFSTSQFTPPPPSELVLPRNTNIVLTKAKLLPPGEPSPPWPRSLTDLAGQNPNTRPNPNSTRPSTTLPEKPVERVEVPEGDALKSAQTAVAGVYGDRIRAATKPEDKQKLAADLLKTASGDSNAARSYAMLLEARKLALASFDVSLGLQILDEQVRRFEVDRVALLDKLLGEFAPRSLALPQRELLVDEAYAATFVALKEGKVALADSLSTLATSSASKAKDPQKKKITKELRDRVVAVKGLHDAMLTATEKLKSAPDDEAAHLAVGRYEAFVLGDFKKGAEHLAQGSNAQLAAIAKQQLEAKSDDERLEVASAWAALVSDLKLGERLGLQRHVVEECRELLPNLTGLAKAQAEKHIAAFEAVVTEAEKAEGVAAGRGNSSRLKPGLIARMLAGRTPTPYLIIANSTQDLFNRPTSNLLRAYGNTSARYAMSGQLVLNQDAEVEIFLDGCTCTIGSQTMDVQSGFGRPEMVRLKKGSYPITLLTTSSSPSFVFRTQQGVQETLLFHAERDLEAELEKTVASPGGPVKSARID